MIHGVDLVLCMGYTYSFKTYSDLSLSDPFFLSRSTQKGSQKSYDPDTHFNSQAPEGSES